MQEHSDIKRSADPISKYSSVSLKAESLVWIQVIFSANLFRGESHNPFLNLRIPISDFLKEMHPKSL